MVKSTTVKRFIQSPARAITPAPTRPEENTTALGGVATGNMKAAEAARAVGTITMRGSSPAAAAASPTTGKRTAVVAVLDVISVKKLTAKATPPTRSQVE